MKQCQSISSGLHCELDTGHVCFHKCGGVTWEDGEGVSKWDDSPAGAFKDDDK